MKSARAHLRIDAKVAQITQNSNPGSSTGTPRSSGCTPLTLAARGGSTPTILASIQRGEDVNELDDYGRSPLHNAVKLNTVRLEIPGKETFDRNIVALLCAPSAKPNTPDRAGATALTYYANANESTLKNPAFVDSLFCLLVHGAELNSAAAASDGRTPKEIFNQVPAIKALLAPLSTSWEACAEQSLAHTWTYPAIYFLQQGAQLETETLGALLQSLLEKFGDWKMATFLMEKGAQLDSTNANELFIKALESQNTLLANFVLPHSAYYTLTAAQARDLFVTATTATRDRPMFWADWLVERCDFSQDVVERYQQFRASPRSGQFSIEPERPRSPPQFPAGRGTPIEKGQQRPLFHNVINALGISGCTLS